MHSRRSFFGILTGLAALLPLPALARTEKLPQFYSVTFDTDFLELPQDTHIYQWDQPMKLRGVEYLVRRIKMMVPGERLDIPVMFNLPELAGAAVLQSQGGGKPPQWVKRARRAMLPAFEEENGHIIGEEFEGEGDPDVLTNRLAAVIDAVMRNGFDGPVEDGHPLWVTLHQHGERVRHMMTCTQHILDADDMLLTLPAGRSASRIFREPPCPHDAGEDGPWRANPGLWQPPSV